ncbi:xanthine dehydrogenase family protein molybdopterin-binding subunit [Nakamurella deserti]|uniref:xanthine dehydrogenase family protein molybdopterin-binding subunit n=1 Tax=Nakamurella deserti TaxID=2164074 RepID=UPI000DBE2E14|nr:xanthine dehydrogenase family protein molybdopterin-binding subunit [Nakamurella deserti]
MTATVGRALGTPRVEGPDKVTGAARYAAEHHVDGLCHGWIHGARIARGRVLGVDVDAAMATPGVLAVFWHGNAPRLSKSFDAMTDVLQSAEVAFRGQVVALVVAETPEVAREVATTLHVEYATEAHDVVLTDGHPGLYTPKRVNGFEDGDSVVGEPEAELAAAPVVIDAHYTTPAEHNNPMEPHATVAQWSDGGLTVHDSNQGGVAVQAFLAKIFLVKPGKIRVLNHHVGGGFGSKGTPRPGTVLAAMASRELGRPVRVVLTRQQLFDLVGYRTPTRQRVRLGAGTDGRLRAITHEALSQCSTRAEFVEQSAAGTRVMYAAPHRRTTHQVVELDVPMPSWLRAPGHAPGMFALESAMDELAVELGMDPVELRRINEPTRDPEKDIPFSSRNLLACMDSGAQRFGWDRRVPEVGAHRDGAWVIGHGMAASTYPVLAVPSVAKVMVDTSGRYVVAINATDIGTGARTALRTIAAEELDVPADRIVVMIGDTRLPMATIAGGSMGTASWGWAVSKACRKLRAKIARTGIPEGGLSAKGNTALDVVRLPKQSRHAFGAQFVEVRVHSDTGEVRVPRMVGVFAAGRIVNPVTARSQFLGGMTMGVSMALHEHGVMDPQFGDHANHDLATYHVAANADIGEIDVSWLDEVDPDVNGPGVKGIGEIGIVGTAAAVANAVFNATGVRVRDLPVKLDKLLT